MAHIDTLIARISDPGLRAQLVEEVAKLVERKDFGLVFQRHLPQDVETPGVRPRRGDTVRLRGDASKQNYVVLSARGAEVSILPVDASKATVDGSGPDQRNARELVVVKDLDLPVYPGLRPLGGISRGGDKPTHVVIEGENYYALETLLYTHERKVDAIMIDPPYNTGSDSWIYNDRFVAENDTYRHSKWLSFMERRLHHAKRLLKATGVLVVAVDDVEQARLKLLLDQEMGENNFIGTVCWQGNVKNDSRFLGGGLDYMLIYARDKDALSASGAKWRVEKDGAQRLLDQAAKFWKQSKHDPAAASEMMISWLAERQDAFSSGLLEYKFIDPSGFLFAKNRTIDFPGGGGPKYDVRHPATGNLITPPSNGWRASEETMKRWIAEGIILFDESDQKLPTVKRRLVDNMKGVVPQVFRSDRRAAANRLKTILGSKEFPYPKDSSVIARWLNVVTGENPDAVFLDFFVGTGTTAESVMLLNAMDGGRRQAIVVTNNELAKKSSEKLAKAGFLAGDPEWEAEGVFQKVTKPRIETVVSGMRPDGSRFSDGMNENVSFYKLTYEDENLVALGRKYDAIAPLLWMKAGGIGAVVRRDESSTWSLPDDAYYGVLFDVAGAREFAGAIERRELALNHVFVVADSESAFQTAVSYLPMEQRLNTTRLYSDYLRSFEINGKG